MVTTLHGGIPLRMEMEESYKEGLEGLQAQFAAATQIHQPPTSNNGNHVSAGELRARRQGQGPARGVGGQNMLSGPRQ